MTNFNTVRGAAKEFRWFLLMLSLHVAILLHGVFHHYPNVDEVAHLPAGVAHWQYSQFDLYRVNPPLVRLWASLPLAFMDDMYDWRLYSEAPGQRPESDVGMARLHDVRLELIRDFWIPRILCIPFSIIGCVLLSWFAYSMFGKTAALLACCLWCFSPNILAHAQTIVPDVGAVSMGLVACTMLWRYLQKPNLESAFWFGVALGAAMLTKLTWLTGIVTFPVVGFVCVWLFPSILPSEPWVSRIRQTAIALLVALTTLNVGYLFDGTFTQLGDYDFCSQMLGGPGANRFEHGNRFRGTPLATIPVPLPSDYVRGVDYLKFEVEDKYWSFLRGEWKKGSWWYYYLYSTAVKTPLASLAAAGLGMVVLWRYWGRKAIAMFLVIAVPSLYCVFSVSYQGGFNHHHRYVLFVYPVFYLLAAGCVQDKLRGSAIANIAKVLCGISIVASLSVWPHFLSFFNQTVGGPRQAWHVLGFSNIDWGQDLLYVDKWIRENQDARPCAVHAGDYGIDEQFFGLSDVEVPRLLLKDNRMPHEIANNEAIELPQDGYYIVSVKHLYDLPGYSGTGYFRFLEPIDRIAYSYLVYQIGDEERRQIRGLITGEQE